MAARTFFETAANLGDSDSMAEAARCYEKGIGGPKDKVRWRHDLESLPFGYSTIMSSEEQRRGYRIIRLESLQSSHVGQQYF